MVFRSPLQELSFQLELNDGNGLVNLDIEPVLRLGGCFPAFYLELDAGIILIHVQGKSGQWKQIDSVAILQDVKISIAGADSRDGGDAGKLACCRSHPDHVMVSPLDIQRVILHKLIHNEMRTRTAVVNIPQNMQMIHYQTLNELRQGNNEIFRTVNGNDGIHDGVVVAFLIQHFGFFRNQFLNDVSIIFRQSFPHLGPGIFGRNLFADFDEPVQHDFVPVIHIRFRLPHVLDLLFRIVNERCQSTLIRCGQRVSEDIVNLLPYCPGTIPQHMGKCFVFPVNVCQKMFRPLGQIQNRLKIDNLRGRRRDRRI